MSKFKIIGNPKLVCYISNMHDIIDTHCSICRKSLEENSAYNENTKSGSEIKTSMCNHTLHYECIRRWLNNNNRCPNCSNKWIYKI
jgi:DNA-directed RNA polymerase subunit RPC12/RpoP